MTPYKKYIINAIQTDAGYFIQEELKNPSYRNDSGLENLFFDGKKPEKTHEKTWVKILDKPSKIEVEQGQEPINYRYELKDPSIASDKIPQVFKQEDVAIYDSKEYCWTFKPEYSHLFSLYELKYDKQPIILVNLDFEFNVICQIDNIKEYAGLSYPVQKTRWSSEGTIILDNSSIKHQLIDRIVFPDPILPSKPCELSSQDSYKVIREHVIRNINRDVASITSNYDFCFTVKKKIGLTEPIKYQKDISSFRARKPKYITKYRSEREVEIFEMTYSPENYKDYTPIPGFKGKNHEDLKNNIDEYLNNLMKMINEPLRDCEHCKGLGVVLNDKKENGKF